MIGKVYILEGRQWTVVETSEHNVTIQDASGDTICVGHRLFFRVAEPLNDKKVGVS